MPKKKARKVKKVSEKELLESGIYKGYSIKWLRETPEHPDFHLVAEYDKLKK